MERGEVQEREVWVYREVRMREVCREERGKRRGWVCRDAELGVLWGAWCGHFPGRLLSLRFPRTPFLIQDLGANRVLGREG